MHKKKIRKAIKHLRVFSKKLDKEKHSRPKAYQEDELRLDPVVDRISKL